MICSSRRPVWRAPGEQKGPRTGADGASPLPSHRACFGRRRPGESGVASCAPSVPRRFRAEKALPPLLPPDADDGALSAPPPNSTVVRSRCRAKVFGPDEEAARPAGFFAMVHGDGVADGAADGRSRPPTDARFIPPGIGVHTLHLLALWFAEVDLTPRDASDQHVSSPPAIYKRPPVVITVVRAGSAAHMNRLCGSFEPFGY